MYPTYDTSTLRLLAVADHIENNPDEYNQASYGPVDAPEDAHPYILFNECGSRGCIAWWAVVFTPAEHEAHNVGDFDEAGMLSLDLDDGLAEALFAGWFALGRPVGDVANILRVAATLRPGARSIENLRSLLGPSLAPLLADEGDY